MLSFVRRICLYRGVEEKENKTFSYGHIKQSVHLLICFLGSLSKLELNFYGTLAELTFFWKEKIHVKN